MEVPPEYELEKAALTKAKITLMSRRDTAFFTTVLFSLKIIWDPSCPTAYTDGKVIGLNPKFFMGLTLETRIFLLLHEAMHVAYLHMDRLLTRHAKKWNIAADHVINLMLIKRGFKMPANGYADTQYSDLNTEQVYALLPDPEPNKDEMDLRSPPKGDEELNQEVSDILMRASIQSRLSGDTVGTIPSDIAIWLDELLDPVLPWNRILKKHITALDKADYSFKKFNRRYFPKYLLPGLKNNKLMDLTIALDTSGSVSDSDFKVFVSEVHGIFRMMKPKKITLLQFDTAIKSVTEVKNIHDLNSINFVGRGGTYISPIVNWVNTNKPGLVLVFSDGYFDFNKAASKVPFIWVVHNNVKFSAPFGKVIHYKT